MKNKNIITTGISALATIFVIVVLQARASPHALATSAARPTLVPLPTDAPTQSANPAQHTGGFIVLHLNHLPTDAQAGVQWEGPPGTWHNVEGWQSDANNKVILWWVSPADFGKGPFRWVVHRGNVAQPISVSASFYLPRWLGDEVVVDLK